ncbi:MAG: hypothetical protein M3N49_15605 [Candidatus Eremiobacteraeota bacterium]|nr:hypothetical protein [Candidatus Eremiobacteraeota bacterium]
MLSLAVPGPASSDDGDAVLEKMQAATRAASSFTARFEPTIHMSWVVVEPDRIRRVMPSRDGEQMEDWIVIGHQSYSRDGNGPWKAGSEQVDGIRWGEIAPFLNPGTTARALPDYTDAGTVVGALDVLLPEQPLAKGKSIKAFHMTCSYEKATYRPRACSFQTVAKIYVTTWYEHWNDAANVIEPPPGVPLPTPLPQASAAP